MLVDVALYIPEILLTRGTHVICACPTLSQLNCQTRNVYSTYKYIEMFNKPATTLLGLLTLCLTIVVAAGTKDKLQIGVKYKPDECPLKTRNGDKLSMQ